MKVMTNDPWITTETKLQDKPLFNSKITQRALSSSKLPEISNKFFKTNKQNKYIVYRSNGQPVTSIKSKLAVSTICSGELVFNEQR